MPLPPSPAAIEIFASSMNFTDVSLGRLRTANKKPYRRG
jgi:hypothetical protein